MHFAAKIASKVHITSTYNKTGAYSYSLNMIKSGETTIEIGRNGDRNVYDDPEIV